MIDIRIQVFSKEIADQPGKRLVGAHMEVEAVKDKPKEEIAMAEYLARAIHIALNVRAQGQKKARIIECSGDSDINDALRREFGLDENGPSKQG